MTGIIHAGKHRAHHTRILGELLGQLHGLHARGRRAFFQYGQQVIRFQRTQAFQSPQGMNLPQRRGGVRRQFFQCRNQRLILLFKNQSRGRVAMPAVGVPEQLHQLRPFQR